MHKLLQTSWTAFFGVLATVEGIVLAWCAEKMYKVWSKAYAFVRVRLPWQTKNEVTDGIEAEAEAEVEAQPKRGRYRQAAIDARNDYKTVCCCNEMTESFE